MRTKYYLYSCLKTNAIDTSIETGVLKVKKTQTLAYIMDGLEQGNKTLLSISKIDKGAFEYWQKANVERKEKDPLGGKSVSQALLDLMCGGGQQEEKQE